MAERNLTFADAFGGLYLPTGVHESKAAFTCRTCMDAKDWTRCAALVTAYDSGTYKCVSCGTILDIDSGHTTAKVD